jgi:hypothetical protein
MYVTVRLYFGTRTVLKVGFRSIESAKRWLREHRRSFVHTSIRIECNNTN